MTNKTNRSQDSKTKSAPNPKNTCSTRAAANGFPAGTDWVYTDIVKEHFLNPRNFLMGDESKYRCDAKGIVGNPICGDQMLMMIQVENIKDEKTGKTEPVIKDVKWKTYGCASAIASTSALSELAKGRTLDNALKISAEEIEEYLGGLPKHKFHCSVLGHEALAAAIEDYKKNH
ncbi:iron-sulfur cluster assembly scaffold protein [Candidatus Saccharibacteria bacterium]|nr:iron-sulfur cluster assembly scaffold protein [Candidatus Saccharibacteria bacterium]